MCKYKVGLIRVLTTEDEELLLSHGRLIMLKFPEVEVITKCIPNQYDGINCKELYDLAVPKIVEIAKSFEDVDMIIISCADDPGLEEVREVVTDIPVIGCGETGLGVSLMYGRKIGLLSITKSLPRAYQKIADQIILGKPDNVNSTRDLMIKEGRDNMLKVAKELKEKGAEVIALGCTGLVTIGIEEDIEKVTGLRVINPVLVAGMLASYESKR